MCRAQVEGVFFFFHTSVFHHCFSLGNMAQVHFFVSSNSFVTLHMRCREGTCDMTHVFSVHVVVVTVEIDTRRDKHTIKGRT